MRDSDVVVRDVQWARILPVGHLLRAFRIALWPPTKLVLCLAALVIVVGAGILLDRHFQTKVYSKSFQENLHDVFLAATGYFVEAVPQTAFKAPPAGSSAPTVEAPPSWEVIKFEPSATMVPNVDIVTNMRGFYFGPVEALRHGARLVVRYWVEAPKFAAALMVISFLTWTFFGGAVCRLAALQFARDERATMREALAFACRKYGTLLAGRLGLLIVLLLLVVPAALVVSGVLQLGGVGQIITGALFFLLLGLGILAALLFLFAAGSQCLILPAVAAEGRDAFDAVSRSVNYVFARPWKYILYSVFSILYLCLTFVVVRLFTLLVLKIPYLFIDFWPWMGPSGDGSSAARNLSRIWTAPTMAEFFRLPEGAEGAEHVAAVMVGVYVVFLLGLMVAFLPSFVMTSQTIIYFLLRRRVDCRDIEEVYMEAGPEAAASTFEKTEETVVEPEPPAARKGEDESD